MFLIALIKVLIYAYFFADVQKYAKFETEIMSNIRYSF